jgi:signal peptide peptidase SppA
MTRSVSKRKTEMTAALSQISGEVWAMEPVALSAMVAQIAQVAENGKRPEVEVPQRQAMVHAETEAGLVAIIPITGVIRPHNDAITRSQGGTALSVVVAEYLSAWDDDRVVQIVLYFDTPGGSVAGVADAANILARHAQDKPTVAIVGGMCASAGYWLAAAVPQIRANPDSLIGSIGVMMVDMSVARLYGEFGFDIDVVHFGERKVDGNPFAPMSPERHAAFQESVDEYGAAFVAHVAQSRGVTADVVRAEFGDGRVYPGTKAKTRGMIDAVVPMFGRSQTSQANPSRATGKTAAAITFRDVPIHDIAAAATLNLGDMLPGTGRTLLDAISVDVSQILATADHVPTPAATVGSAATGPIEKAATTATATERKTIMAMSARVKSALYATGFTQSQDAPDAVCEAALSAFYLARGAEQPADEKQLLGDLASVLHKPTMTTLGAIAEPFKPAAVSADDYRDRLEALQSIADLVNASSATPVITSAMVMESAGADNYRKPIEVIQKEWKEKMTASAPRIGISITGTGEGRLETDAVNAIAYKLTGGRKGKANDLVGCHPLKLAKLSLQATQQSVDFEDREAMAKAALGFAPDGVTANAGPVNRAGDFPNIMNAVSTIIMDDAVETARLSFPVISDELPPAETMDVASIGGFAVIDSLDAHVDGDDAKEKKLQEESKGFIKPVHYANDICLTWLMLTDAMKFQNFLTALAELGVAGPRQLNRTIIGMIANNVQLIDGFALFDAGNHGNLVAPGGAPSDTNLEANRALHSAQRALGASDPSGADPKIVLTPDALKVTASRAFQTIITFVGGQAVANVEASQSYFKDNVMVVSDPMLDAYSTSRWYSLVLPSNRGLRSIVHRYKAGYGPTGVRSDYLDPKKRGRVYSIDFVAGAAIAGHKGIVRNGS